jgi:tetratricopeptide (TPR) repeat protein
VKSWIALAVAVPLLAMGGVTRATLIAGLLVAGIAGMVARSRANSTRTPSTPTRLVSVALWFAVGVCILQLVPLPSGLHRVLSPESWRLWREAAVAFGDDVGWRPLTMDPAGTAFAAATAIGVAIYFGDVSRVASGHDGRRGVASALAFAVVVFDVIALLHPIFGVEKLYGVYTPQSVAIAEAKVLAPLLNPNHAAAVACVGPPLLIGLAMDDESEVRRFLLFLAAALSGAVAVLTLSRGGIAVFIAEILLMSAIAYARRGRRNRNVRLVLGGVLALAGSIGAASYVALPAVLKEASDHDVSKLEIPRRALHAVGDFARTGIGRGAFSSVFPSYQGDLGSRQRFTHVENWPVQLIVELGVPCALVVVGLVLFAVARSSVRALDRGASVGALVALLGLIAHDLADFSMEFLATGLVATTLLAIVTSSGTTGLRRPEDGAATRRWRPEKLLLTALAVALAAKDFGHSVEEDASAVASAWSAGALAYESPELRRAGLRHPTDPYFSMARAALDMRSPAAGALFARAVRLGPGRAQTHFWFARWFAMMGRRGQAWAEYREAMRLDQELGGAVLVDMVAQGAPTADILSASNSPESLDRAANELIRLGRNEQAAALDGEIVERFPNAVAARLREIQRAAQSGDVGLARARAERMVAVLPNEPRGHLTLSRLQPSEQAAQAALERGIQLVPEDADLLLELIRRRGTVSGLAAVATQVEQVSAVLARRGEGLERLHAVEALVEEARGNAPGAVKRLLDAASVSSQPRAHLEAAARLADRTGQYDVAELTWRRLAELVPADASYAENAARSRKQARERLALPSFDAPVPAGTR